MKLVFTGGGTGGHIYPALAIREILLREFNFISSYVGVKDGMEENIVKRESDIEFFGLRAMCMPRTLTLKWLIFPFINIAGVIDAFNHLKSFKPDLVIATGGFVAFPVLAAARLLGIPFVIHEQNAAMGITNRLFMHKAAKVLLTYASATREEKEKIILTGNPVRASFLKSASSSHFLKNEKEFVILSVGGSRGALSLNKACVELAKNWLPVHRDFRLIHISGERDYEMIKRELGEIPRNYQLFPYLHEMKEAFEIADLVVSRAGATILSEISVCGKPAILIPFPFATDNHQEKNARILEEKNAAKVLLDKNLNGRTLGEMIKELRDSGSIDLMSRAMRSSRPENVEEKILSEISTLIK